MPSKEISLRDRATMLASGIEGSARRLEDAAEKILAMQEHIELEPARALLKNYVQMVLNEVQSLRGDKPYNP